MPLDWLICLTSHTPYMGFSPQIAWYGGSFDSSGTGPEDQNKLGDGGIY